MTHGGRWRGWGGRGLALLTAVWLGAGGWAEAQVLKPVRLPPRPVDGVHDDARMFTEGQHAAAAKAIAEAKRDGVAIYLAAFTFIVDESIERRAERLRAAWCGDEIGLIVVVDASTSQCSYLSHLSEHEWLPSEQLRQIFGEATEASIAKETPGERLLSVVENLVPRIHSALASRGSPARNPGSVREWVVFGAVVAACGLLVLVGWMGLRLGRRVRANQPGPAFFPTVAVEPRFGGAFAGGVAVELDFRGVGRAEGNPKRA